MRNFLYLSQSRPSAPGSGATRCEPTFTPVGSPAEVGKSSEFKLDVGIDEFDRQLKDRSADAAGFPTSTRAGPAAARPTGGPGVRPHSSASWSVGSALGAGRANGRGPAGDGR